VHYLQQYLRSQFYKNWVKLNNMKKLLPIFILFLISCKSDVEEIVLEPLVLDSVIENSKIGLDSAAIVSVKSDSVTKEKVTKVINNIQYLTREVEKYKEIELTLRKTVATEKIIYKTDTVFIEKKKNFWGKEKTNTTVKSDSVVDNKIDTTLNY